MKIKFDGKKRHYELTGNDRQFVLSELVIAQTGKLKGEYVAYPIGYYNKLENVINKIVHLEIVDSKSSTFAELLKAIRETKDYISAIVSEKYKP